MAVQPLSSISAIDVYKRQGLLGLMTALPTTPSFMDYEAVYLPKNHFIKEESMATDKYLSLFYPFDQLDLVKKGIESTWNVSGDRTMVALTMTFMDEPMAKNMSFQREYAEPYDLSLIHIWASLKLRGFRAGRLFSVQ